MADVKIFKNEEFGEVRTLTILDEVYFVGKDVAKILGYAKPENAISNHVDEEDKTSTLIQGSGSNYKSKAIIINESGLYSLILSSKLPNAKKFKRWVTKEVLPSIRKNGGYIANQENSTPEEILANAIIVANNVIKRQEKQIEEMSPKALFADCVSSSKNSILIRELAKILHQNGCNIGQNRLFEWLRNNGYLIRKRGTDYNMPTQKAMELKLFEIKETAITHSDGQTSVSRTAKVTGKGQQYFINKFIQKYLIKWLTKLK